MRIAVPVMNGQLNQHFGRSAAFWICNAAGDPPAITEAREVQMTQSGGCGAIPAFLAEHGVELVIAGGMGAGAAANLNRCGIRVIVGAPAGTPQQIVGDLLAGQLVASGQSCQEHGHESHGHQEHDRGHGHGACCSQPKGT